jgi:hypothetical protein
MRPAFKRLRVPAALGVNLRPDDKQPSLELERCGSDPRAGGETAAWVVSPDKPVAADKFHEAL